MREESESTGSAASLLLSSVVEPSRRYSVVPCCIPIGEVTVSCTVLYCVAWPEGGKA